MSNQCLFWHKGRRISTQQKLRSFHVLAHVFIFSYIQVHRGVTLWDKIRRGGISCQSLQRDFGTFGWAYHISSFVGKYLALIPSDIHSATETPSPPMLPYAGVLIAQKAARVKLKAVSPTIFFSNSPKLPSIAIHGATFTWKWWHTKYIWQSLSRLDFHTRMWHNTTSLLLTLRQHA